MTKIVNYLCVLCFSLLATFLFTVIPAQADTITVTISIDENAPNGDCSLREAIIAANTNTPTNGCPAGSSVVGDTIILTSTTYSLTLSGAEGTTATNATLGDLDIIEALTITGVSSASTIIDASLLIPRDRVFHVENSDVVFENLQIINGQTNATNGHGAGIYLNTGSLIVNNSQIADNQARGLSADGGGIFGGGDVILNNTKILSNSAEAYGGGIQATTALTAINSWFEHNEADLSGGGIAVVNLTLSNSQVIDNWAATGGGVAVYANSKITHTMIAFNQADNGGGLYIANATTLFSITNGIIAYNTSINNHGGGIYIDDGTLIIRDSQLLTNIAGTDGGAMYQYSGTSTISNSCIVDNSDNALVYSGGVSPIIAVGNWWGTADGPSGNGSGSGDSVTSNVNYSSFLTSPPFANCSVLPMADLSLTKTVLPAIAFPGEKITYTIIFTNHGPNIATNVTLTDSFPVSVTNISITNQGATITQTSGANYIWAVEDMAVGQVGVLTITGQLALTTAAGLVDNLIEIIGVEDITLTNNTTMASLTVAEGDCYATYDGITVFNSLDGSAVQQAVDTASVGDTIKVAGTCMGVQTRAGLTQTLYISQNLTIRGGYTTSNWLTADPMAYPTTLDAQQSGRVIYITSAGVNSTLENLQVINGYITGDGGGIYAENSLTLSNVTVFSNTASASKGGVYITNDATIVNSHFEKNVAQTGNQGGLHVAGNLLLTNTIFISNIAHWAGGAYINGEAWIVDSLFERNRASGHTAGFHVGANLTMLNTDIISNTAISATGGANIQGQAIIIDSNFVGNESQATQGGLRVGGDLLLTNTDFISNTATNWRAAVYVMGNATINDSYFERNMSRTEGKTIRIKGNLTMSNTTFINNQVYMSVGGVMVDNQATIINSHFENNVAQLGSQGGLQVKGDLSMTNTDFINNTAAQKAGGLWVAGSATINGGLFENNQAGSQGGGAYISETLTLSGTTFISNKSNDGAGLYHHSHPGYIVNTLFAENQADSDGSGLYLNSNNIVEILHSTIASPTVGSGHAIYVANGMVAITNTIIASYTTGLERASGTVNEDYNLFFGNGTDRSSGITAGSHSFNGDPAFNQPLNVDYTLTESSVAIDAGLDLGIPIDFERDIRPYNATFPDIGYDESPYSAIADLAITKTVNLTTTWPGETITYHINFTNLGPHIARNILITELLPIDLLNTSIITAGVAMTQTSNSSWQIQDMMVNQTGLITITGQIALTTPIGFLINEVEIISTGDITSANNIATAVLTITWPDIDLEISKRALDNPVQAGSILTYHLVVTNNGPETAYNVEVIDLLPAEVTYVSGQAKSGSCSQASGIVTCIPGYPSILLVDDDANTDDVRPFYTSALDALGYSYTIYDVGGGAGNGPTATTMNNYDVVIWFSGDKSATANAGPTSIDETSLTTYLNNGGRLFLSSQDYYTGSVTPFMINYLGVSSVTADVGNNLPIIGYNIFNGFPSNALTYGTLDPRPDNLTPNATGTVAFRDNSNNNLALYTSNTVFFAVPWEAFQNADPIDGEDIMQTILDHLTTNQLAMNQASVMTITVAINPTATGVITNLVNVTAPGNDLVITNNQAVATTTVENLVDLSISKIVAPTVAAPGDIITYTIAFTNHGPSDATNILITDSLPISVTSPTIISHGVTIIETSGWPIYGWQVANLASGDTGFITITGQVSLTTTGSQLDNLVEITTTGDITSTNNSATATLTLSAGDCYATHNDGGTVFNSSDSLAVRQAYNVAPAVATIKVAGYCAGVTLENGTEQLLYINNNLTLQGGYTITNWLVSDPTTNPTTLDAQGAGRVIYANNSIVTLANIILTNGIQTYGGGIYVTASSVTLLTGTIVISNQASEGGGIYAFDGLLTMQEGQIISNTATSHGGGIMIGAATFTQNGGEIAHNQADEGGGIHNVSDGTIIFNNGQIYHNQAHDSGGGVYSSGAFDVNNGQIISNTATISGGGIYIEKRDFTINGGQIINNLAEFGGGVYYNGDYDTFTMNGGVIVNNRANRHGGGIYNNDNGGLLQIVGGIIHTNQANNNGGGIFLANTARLQLQTGGTVTNNEAQLSGGGIYVDAGEVSLQGGLVNRNSAQGIATSEGGGGLYLNTTTAVLSQTSGFIRGNEADYGGGVYLRDGQMTLVGGQILSNTANNDGGGIYLSTSSSRYTQTGGLVWHNQADSGGAIMLNQGDAWLSGGNIYSNTAHQNGGAIYLADASADFVQSNIVTIAYNSADQFGGAFYLDNGIANLNTVRVLSNTALSDGGAFYKNNGTLMVSNSCIVGNSDIAILNATLGTINAQSNWWGTTDGPSGVGPGRGDSVNNNVDYSGYLTAIIPGCPETISLIDLAVSKDVSNLTPFIGDQLTFTIRAENNSSNLVSAVVVTDVLPSGFNLEAVTTTQGSYDNRGIWDIGAISAVNSVTMTMLVTVLPTGTYTNVAQVGSSNIIDIDATNDVVTVAIALGEADLALSKTVNNATPAIGDLIIFTVTVRNDGPDKADLIQVEDTLPTGYTFITATATTGHYDNNTGVWDTTVAVGTAETLTLVAQTLASGNFTNTAEIRFSQLLDPDSIPNNGDPTEDDYAQVIVSPQLQADLWLTKTVNTVNPPIGSQLIITVTITNDGPSPAMAVAVEDILPDGYRFVSATPSQGSYDSTTGIWTIDGLNTTAQAELIIRANVLATGQYNLYAQILNSDPTDPDSTPGNNSGDEDDDVSLTIIPQVAYDLEIVKQVNPTIVTPGDSITYTLTFSNTGAFTITGAVITDILPSELRLPTYQAQGVLITATGSTAYVWQLAELAPATNGKITITAQLQADTPVGSSVVNTASLGSRFPEIETVDNFDTAIIQVETAPLIDLDSSSPTLLGQMTGFTVTVLSGHRLTYTWNFGDGSALVTTSKLTTTHQYTQTGLFIAQVMASNGSMTVTEQIRVQVGSSLQNLTLTVSVTETLVNLPVTFSSTVIGTSPFTYIWNFGDGTIIVGQDSVIDHTFITPGVYPIIVTATNGFNILTDTASISVYESVFGVSLDSSAPGLVNLPIYYTATVLTGDDLQYWWHFGDGMTKTTTVPTISHRYSQTGIYTTEVIVSNRVNTATSQILVVIAEPLLGINLTAEPTQTYTNSNITFRAEITGRLAITLAGPIIYTWDFGDGTISSNINPATVHAYQQAGSYTITVTADNGASQVMDSVRVTIVSPLIGVIISPNPQISQLQQTVGFTLTPIGGLHPISYTVSFGDGTISSITINQFFSHSYSETGLYQVVVTATDGLNIVTSTVAILVEQPLNGLTINTTSPITVNTPALFEVILEAGTNPTYLWDFGDGSPLVQTDSPTLTHIYTEPGIYTATLTVTNGISTITGQVQMIVDEPIENLLVTPAVPTGTVNLPLTFTISLSSGTNVGGQNGLITYTVDFGDGMMDAFNGPPNDQFIHVYTQTGIYQLIITATNSLGFVTYTLTITITEADIPTTFDLLIVEHTTSANRVTQGDYLVYQTMVLNTSNVSATNVTMIHTWPTDTAGLPAFYGFSTNDSTTLAVAHSEGTALEPCLLVGGVLTCQVDSLAPGSRMTINLMLSPRLTGMLTSTVSATANEVDPIPDNNRMVVSTTVVAPVINPTESPQIIAAEIKPRRIYLPIVVKP